MTRSIGTASGPALVPDTAGERAPHRRQFVLGPESCSLVPGWRQVRLGELWLSHCPTLPAEQVDDADGQPWAILGRVVETRADRPGPSDQVARTPTDGVPSLYAGWSGRWVLVGGGGEVHLDATGLLGCFTIRSERDGRTWASSSAPLAARLASEDGVPEIRPWPLRYEDSLPWVVPPYTRYEHVRRLLPSQVVSLVDGSVRSRSLVSELDPGRPYEETLSLLYDAVAIALRRLVSSSPGPTWLGLTAGADSRLFLATAHDTACPIRTFTRRSPRGSLADIRLPPILAATVDVEHHFIDGSRPADAAALVGEHTGGHVGAGDAEPFRHGDRERLTGLMIGGWGSAMGREFRDLPTFVESSVGQAESLFRSLHLPARSPAARALTVWLEWVSASPQGDLEFRDRFSIEQRYTGWLASKEQLYDLDPVERVSLLNAPRIVGLLLSLPEEARLSRRWQYELIRRVAPELSAFPYNPPDRHFGLGPALTHRARHPIASARRVGRRARSKARTLSSSLR